MSVRGSVRGSVGGQCFVETSSNQACFREEVAGAFSRRCSGTSAQRSSSYGMSLAPEGVLVPLQPSSVVSRHCSQLTPCYVNYVTLDMA